MSIKITIGQLLQRFTENQETVEVSGKTVRDCLEDLIRKFPDIRQYLFDRNGILMVMIMLNGVTILQKGLNKKISDGDELSIIHMVGGG